MTEDGKELRFKVGDKVKVIGNSCYHKFEIGKIVTIDKICVDIINDEHYKAFDGNDFWWIEDRDLELLNSEPNVQVSDATMPNSNSEGGYYYDLFKFFSDNHGLTLVDTEIQDIIHAVEKFNNNGKDNTSTSY